MMETQSPSSDIISSLPQNIIEYILTLMPIRDALRTSILSKRWRHCWMTMPILVFDYNLVQAFTYRGRLVKHKVVNAILHVLLMHIGPLLEFELSVDIFMKTELCQILLYLSRTNVQDLSISASDIFHNLPTSFFSLHGLETLALINCDFQPPVTFNGFRKLKKMSLINVTDEVLQYLLSNCPLLETIELDLHVGRMLNKLPTLVHLKCVRLHVCLKEHNVISSVLCIIMSSPNLKTLKLRMDDDEKLQTHESSIKFDDLQNDSSLTLDHLQHFDVLNFRNIVYGMEFVKLIMAKSHVLKKARIWLNPRVPIYQELKILRDMNRFPRASPSAELIIEKPVLHEWPYCD
ncbi:F-box/FBD/LRR-repeat protein At1g13570-like [Rutidosis leptorrhynchoides]|uniref:F-box/FBD/LRR-repeat protein At1g13570-like n=1 Tax=Rutidosis leptorrhynchoides TaxID=125765 RepID=UPI003A99D21A